MKTSYSKLLAFVVVLISTGILTSNAQTIFGSQEVITTSALGANFVYSCDIDGDGDFDIVSSSQLDDKVVWYENADGNGTFSSQNIISATAMGARSVFACDIDGDGDNDVLSASSEVHDDGVIAWYENTDGAGTFGPANIINNTLFYAWSVFSIDLDGDGDNDVISTSFNDAKTVWYENTDGNGNFGGEQLISSNSKPTSVYACDIDGDGDNDVISTSFAAGKIAWHENNGDGTFNSEQIITLLAGYVRSIYACDIDGDGDYDVISGDKDDGKVAWYENLDGIGTFGEQQIIVTDPGGGKLSVFASDLDDDGDMDVLSASYNNNAIAWYENVDGNGLFGEEQIITGLAGYAYSVCACDLDGDGDEDVVSASYSDSKVALYRNLLFTGVKKLQDSEISIYPNPTNGVINVECATVNIQQIIIFDISGKKIIERNETTKLESMDLSNYRSGIYLLKVETDKGVFVTKLMKE